MDSEVVKSFNKALVSMQESRSSIVSKQKVVEITKAAMNAVRYFKHIVFILERYIAKCRSEYKISALYVIDSILRQGKKQYKHKDVFAPRFLVNLSNTINNILDCESNERLKVVRIINLWQAHQIFPEDAIFPLLQQCQASGLEINPDRVEHLVKGEKADMQIYHNQNKPSNIEKQLTPRPPLIPTTPILAPASSISTNNTMAMGSSGSHRSLDERLSQFSRQKLGFARSNSITATPKTIESGPKTPPLEDQDMRRSEKVMEDSETASINSQEVMQLMVKIGIQLNSQETLERMQKIFNDRVKEQMDIERRRAGNIKNLLSRDFDYSDEEDEPENRSFGNNNGSFGSINSPTNISKEKLLNIANNLIMDPSLQQELRNLAVLPTNQQLQQFKMPDFTVPPPTISRGTSYIQQPTPLSIQYHAEDRNHNDRGRHELSNRKRTREWSSSPSRDKDKQVSSTRHEQKSDCRENERYYRRKRSRSGSPRYRDNEKDRAKEKDKHEREERERHERDRRRIGLPGRLKNDHVLIASRTLWLTKIPSLCSEKDICDAVKEAGIPEKITIIGSKGCAYVTMFDRKTAYKILDRMADKIQVQKKTIRQIKWATIIGLKEDTNDYWESERGYCEIPYSKLHGGNIDHLVSEGACWIIIESLPPHLKDRYTNTGLKEQYNVTTTNLPQNIVLPPMPATATMQQMIPALFNPTAQIQLAAAIASMPPQNITAQIQQTTTPFSIYPSAIKTPQIPRTISTMDGFSNVGFAGFNSGGSRDGEFNRRGRGRGGRGGFSSAGYDNKGGYRGGRGALYRGGNNRANEYPNSRGGRGNFQKYSGSHNQHHSFSYFTSSQQSEVEGNDTGLVEKLQQNELTDQFGNNKPQEKLESCDNTDVAPPGLEE